MRRLNVYCGIDGRDMQPIHDGQTVSIQSPHFSSLLTLYLSHSTSDSGPVRQIDQISYIERPKSFSIQLSESKFSQRWKYEQIEFGIELDQPIEFGKLPVPAFIVKSTFGWVKKVNSELSIENLFSDQKGRELVKDEEWQKAFGSGGKRPCIMTPLICGCTVMNMHPIPSMPMNTLMKSWLEGYPVEIQQQKRKQLACILQSHDLWLTGNAGGSVIAPGRRTQFPRELVEFNAYLFGLNKSGHHRRAYFRKKNQSLWKNLFHHTTQLYQDDNTPHALQHRLQNHYDPNLLYYFEFFADYFSFPTFEFRPNLSSIPFLSVFGNGFGKWLENWKLDLGQVLERKRVWVVCREKGGRGLYFFTMMFELVD